MRTAYETCPVCRGYVMHINMAGEVNDGCSYCKDMGRVRIHDDKGRFTTREVPSGMHPPMPVPDEASAPAMSKAAGSLSADEAGLVGESGNTRVELLSPAELDFMLTAGIYHP